MSLSTSSGFVWQSCGVKALTKWLHLSTQEQKRITIYKEGSGLSLKSKQRKRGIWEVLNKPVLLVLRATTTPTNSNTSKLPYITMLLHAFGILGVNRWINVTLSQHFFSILRTHSDSQCGFVVRMELFQVLLYATFVNFASAGIDGAKWTYLGKCLFSYLNRKRNKN